MKNIMVSLTAQPLEKLKAWSPQNSVKILLRLIQTTRCVIEKHVDLSNLPTTDSLVDFDLPGVWAVDNEGCCLIDNCTQVKHLIDVCDNYSDFLDILKKGRDFPDSTILKNGISILRVREEDRCYVEESDYGKFQAAKEVLQKELLREKRRGYERD